MSDYKEKLAALKSTRKALEANLELVRLDTTELVMDECLKVHKVKPGSIIREGGTEGKEFKIVGVFPNENQDRQPSLKGVKKKKNGEWGIQEVHVWAWNNPWVLISE